ncbi:MAG: M55 family metallopeptidase [Thermoplasmata archaeon]
MKVHITADMEGIAVLSHDEQTDLKGFDYGRMRELMTAEVQAAVEGAKAAGADEILVCDAHDTGRNILTEKLDDDVEVIHGNPYDLGMMSGIDSSFEASIQIGYHSMRHTHAGTLGHTFTYSIAGLWLNGVKVGESGLSAALAGHFGVPLVFVSGDAHAVRQAKELVRGVVGVATKTGIGLYAVRTLTPRRACDLIRKGVKVAIERRDSIRPFVVKRPVRMDVEFERPLMAQYASKIPMTKRVDIKTVSFRAKDVLQAFEVFEVMNQVASYAKNEGPL